MRVELARGRAAERAVGPLLLRRILECQRVGRHAKVLSQALAAGQLVGALMVLAAVGFGATGGRPSVRRRAAVRVLQPAGATPAPCP